MQEDDETSNVYTNETLIVHSSYIVARYVSNHGTSTVVYQPTNALFYSTQSKFGVCANQSKLVCMSVVYLIIVLSMCN